MASVAEIKKRLKEQGITGEVGQASRHYNRNSNTSSEKKSSGYVGSSQYQKIKEKVKKGGISFDELGVDQDYINSYINDTNTFLSTAQDDINGVGWGNASSTYESKNNTYMDLHRKSSNIRTWLNANKSNLDEETYNNLIDSLEKAQSSLSSVNKAFEETKAFYSQFETENDYNNYVQYGELSRYDVNAGQQELDILNGLANEVDDYNKKAISYGYLAITPEEKKRMEEIDKVLKEKGYEDGADGLKGVISEKSAYHNRAKQIQDGIALSSAINNPDFEHYSQAGANVSNPSWEDHKAPVNIFGWTPMGEGEEIGNMVTFAEANKDTVNTDAVLSWSLAKGIDPESTSYQLSLINRYMKDDEKAIYNYYIGKGDKESADAYMSYMIDVLVQREAGEYANKFDDTYMEWVVSGTAGVHNFASGMSNFFNGLTRQEIDPKSSLAYSHELMNSNNEGIWKITNDLTFTTTNMLPSILLSFVPVAGPVLGTTSMGISAAGNGYAEMKRLGYSDDQAKAYGTLVGLSEAGLQTLLGGISKLGGKISGKAVGNLVSKFDNAIARTAIKIGGNMVAEGAEEGIQTVLEPAFKALVTGEDYEAPEWEEVFYSSLLGMLSGGVFEGGPTVVDTAVQSHQTSKQYGNFASDIVTELIELDPNNSLAQKMKARLDSGKKVSGYQLNRLIDANESAMYKQDVSKIKSATESRLAQLGEQGDVSRLAEAIAKHISGEELTRSEINIIKNSKFGQRVINELTPSNIKSGEYSSAWAEVIGTDRINSEEYSRLIADLDDVQNEDFDTKTVDNATVKTQNVKSATEIISETENTPVEESAENGGLQASKTAIENVSEEEKSTVTLAEASRKYGAQAQAMIHTYIEGQDAYEYDSAYKVAFDMGKSGVSLSYALESEATSYLSENQRKLAYEAGKAAADTLAQKREAANKKAVNGKTGRRKGTVKGEGVTISDLKKSFNDTQNRAYKILSTIAEVTGIDIVLYKSEVNADGKFEGAQGRFKWSDDKIYIDINAGLKSENSVNNLAKYAMLRSFSHEFTHFIEKWNPIYYNEFRKVVFDTLTDRGENVHKLIIEKMEKMGLDSEAEVEEKRRKYYDRASREVVAEAMTDILPDSHFVETLATKHKNIFEKLLDMLKEFLADIKAYFNTITHNPSREANTLKEQVGETVHYVENIVKLFDNVAVEAVENYQMTVAIDEVAEKPAKIINTVTKSAEKSADSNKSLYEKYNEIKESYPDNIILYRVGDFFEVLGEDAKTVADILDVTLTGRNDPKHGRIDMCGFPYHIIEKYVDKLRKSHDVVLVDVDAKGEVKVYPMASIKNTNGGITNVQERGEQKADNTRGSNSAVEGTQETAGDRSRVQETVRGKEEKFREVQPLQRQHRGLNDNQWLLDSNNYIVPAQDSDLHKAQKTLTEDYGIECHIVNKSAWKRNAKATTYYGKVYISEDIDEHNLRAVPFHEATHAIKQRGFKPYLDFIERTPEMINMSSQEARDLMDVVLEHLGYNSLDMDEQQRIRFYDELNASVYGLTVSGIIFDNAEIEWITDAFNDFTAYANEFTDIHNQFKANNKQEVKPNVENVDNRDTVQQPNTNRQGDTQVLEGLQTQDVQGDVQRGDTVGDTVERGQEVGRDDAVSVNGAGTRRGPSEGDSQSGDIRRNDELSPEAAEKLHEEVTVQISQQSTEKPKGRNFVIGDTLDLPNGEKARYKANIEAIKLVKTLESEGRYATEQEQAILSKYVGWGGLANAFDERKADWSKEFKELKELLTKEEYELARGSTLNAHYTEISVIKAMYEGLNKLGFNGGRMLEPSSGVGNFVGAMPSDMSAKVKSWTMVELDGITGLIAKYLYPNADVRIQGFEKANIPNNFMDVIISNVPFGNYPITDKAYPKKVTSALHNYFFAKSLDKVRPGGIVMFITSSYTMNSKDETVRRYIMQRADLLGAIRLPDTAFKGNAGTEVVTDILILKKRPANTAYTGEEFLEAPYKYINGYNGAYINSYFNTHPEMVLGTASMDGSMYRGASLTYKALEGKGSLADQIREAFSHIKGKMDYPARLSPEKTNFAVERAGKNTKQDGYVAKNGKIYQNKDGELVEQTVTPKVAERIKGMLEIRDAAKALTNAQQQGLKDTEIKKARANLNKLYDAFVKKNGFLNAPANRSAFNGDPDRYSVFALENWDNDKKTATKSDIFSKNTIVPNRTVNSAKNVAEGLIVSVNQTGGVDVSLIARLTGKTEADVTRELLDSRQVFKNRNGVLETAETYLSGNVRAKLRDAEALVPMDSDYQKNIEALKAVMPEDVSYQDIFVNPGTPWIPSSVYSDFAAYILGGRNTEYRQDIDVTRNPDTGNFTVELKSSYLKYNASNTQKWGTPRRSFIDLFDAMLNSKSVVVKDKLDDGSFVINKDATAAANEKIENITKEFQEWLWKDEARRTELAKLYNETFNSIVTPKYNGDNLTVNGANAMKPLRPHQRNAVQRVISSGGNTLLAHKVGAGKTYEMAAAAMKLKELGLVKKPLFAVPKSLVAQWGTEFIDFFPTAKLLVAEATDFSTANRKVFMNRIANGDYDAVIVSYEQFEKLPVSDDFTRELYQEQINSVIAAIEEAKAEKGAKALSVKDLEKKRKSLQAKIDKLTDKAKDEGNIDFEELGVDSLFIDEAHNFKNLFYTTSMTNVSGLGNKDGSKRAFDLYTKVRYLQKLNGGKGIVFATATPVMNSMSEMYIMQKYLQPDLLEQLGLNTFDAWAKQFGEVVNGVEIKPSGQGYRVKQSFSRFKNMSELQLLFRNFADVLTDIPGLKIPKMKGGAVNVVVCEPGQFQQDYMKELEKRADNIKNVDPSVDNMLKITSDGRKISYTQRMIDPTLPYEEGCKIYRCAGNVVKAYKESKDIKGTQLIFCDMATPKGKSKTETSTETDDASMDMESAKLYDDIKARLIQEGIPAKEIAFIHEADTDQKKKKLFADVNEGKVRVLIGSTGKMGVGMNAQKRVVAIHHLDAPWRPGDVEQRNGRAFRQGNINEEVECFTYVTEGSFDARLWDILERKQNFINQVMNGESVGRETEDTGEVTLSAAEVKALASGSPLIMEQVQLDTDIKKLESLYRAHLSAVRAAKERLEKDKGNTELLERLIELGKSDIQSTKDTYSEGKFSITVGKQKFTEKKDAGVALMAEATAKANTTDYTSIGSFAGFDVRVIKTAEGIKGIISGKQGYPFNTYPNNTTFMINHMISVVEGITEKVKMWESSLAETRKDMAEQEKLINAPFSKQAELDEKRKRYTEVMEILNPKEEQSLDSVAEDTVQEQSRAYLEDELDDFDINSYPKVKMSATEYNKLVSEAMTWNANKTNRILHHSLNGYTYVYTIDESYNITVYKKYKSVNIHERKAKIYDIRSGKQVNRNDGENRDGRRNDTFSLLESDRGTDDRSGGLFDSSTSEKWSSDGRRGTETPIDNDERGTQYQQRSEGLTDYEVLELASNEIKVSDLTQAENDALTIFQDRLARLKTLQDERTEQGRLYKEQQFGAKVNRAEAEKTLNRMHVLDDQIKKATADVLTVEEKEVLKRVLKKARKVVEVQERKHGQEILNRWRDRRNNAAAIKKYRDRLRGDVEELTTWITSPNNKDITKHVPDVLKNSVIPFLSSINFMSKRSLKGGDATVSDKAFIKNLDALKSALKINMDVYGMYSGYNDLPPDFMENLENFIKSAQALVDKSAGEFIINQMTSSELKELSQVVRTLKKYITQFNRFHNNAMYQHVYEAGDNSMEFLKELGNAGEHTGGLSNFVFWQQIRPAYAFERFGKGGEAIYDGLRQGQAKLAFNTKEIQRFTEKAYTSKEVKAWENEIKEFNLGRDIVRIPVSYLMSFYELSKDPQAKEHIVGEGIRVAKRFPMLDTFSQLESLTR